MMRTLMLVALAACVAACNPYMAAVSAVSETYSATTDERSIGTQASDTEIEAKVQAALVESPVSGTDSISVYCRQGVVILTGVVPPDSDAGMAAVKIAREMPGVRRVHTFYVTAEPSKVDDYELEGKIKAAFVEDPNLLEGRVDIVVLGGHVALIGVAANPQQIKRYVDDTWSIEGVVSVRNYIQLPG